MASEPHDFVRRLRKSPTKFEDLLWRRLRGSRLEGAKFKRQVPFDRYVVDFYRHAARLAVDPRTAIRGDGAQHSRYADYDNERTKVLENAGVHVLRFTDDEIHDDSRRCAAKDWRGAATAFRVTEGSKKRRYERARSDRMTGPNLPGERVHRGQRRRPVTLIPGPSPRTGEGRAGPVEHCEISTWKTNTPGFLEWDSASAPRMEPFRPPTD